MNKEPIANTVGKEDCYKKEIPRETKDIREFFEYWGFYISRGCYWFTEFRGKKSNEIRISNFIMEILYHLNDSSNNTKRIIKIQKDSGEIFLKEVYSNEMSNEKFEIILKSVGCTFKGSSYQLKSIFEYLMKEEITAKSFESLGYQKEYDCYAFADGIVNKENDFLKINDLGIVSDKGNLFYLPAFSFANIENDSYSHERHFAYKSGKVNFTEWSDLVYKTFGIDGAIGISYVIAALFRDIVFNDLKFFPFVFLFGQYGTGKTSYIESILSLFGTETIGTALYNVTTSGLSREMSQRVNSIFYYKEFTVQNAEIANPFILNAYDGSGRTIGENSTSNKTKKFLPKSGAFFDGNYLPVQKDAVFSRLIMLVFEENKFSSEQKRNFNLLSAEKEKGLCQIVKEILAHRDFFKEHFKSTYKKNISELDEIKEFNDIPSRLKNHASLIISVYEVMQGCLTFPYGSDELILKMTSYMQDQTFMLDEIKDISNFWKAAEYAKNKGSIIEGTDYIKDKTPLEDNGNIFIKYDIFYSQYVKYCNENQLNKVDKISLKQLLTSKVNESFVPNQQKSRKTKAVIKYGLGSSYQFIFSENESGIIIDKLELNL